MPDVFSPWLAWFQIWWHYWMAPIRDNEAEALRACDNIHRVRLDAIEKALQKEGMI